MLLLSTEIRTRSKAAKRKFENFSYKQTINYTVPSNNAVSCELRNNNTHYLIYVQLTDLEQMGTVRVKGLF